MKKVKKSTFAIIAVFLVIVAITVPQYVKYQNVKKEEQIATCYELQNDAFLITSLYIYAAFDDPSRTVYYTLEENELIPLLYAWTLIYEQETGNALTIAEIEEYLSREFEEDGTRRLYVNYENENIQGYVEFMKYMWDKTRAQVEMYNLEELRNIPWEDRGYAMINSRLGIVYDNLPEEIKEQYNWTNMPFELVEEIVKKVYNPEYEMQLDAFLLQE